MTYMCGNHDDNNGYGKGLLYMVKLLSSSWAQKFKLVWAPLVIQPQSVTMFYLLSPNDMSKSSV